MNGRKGSKWSREETILAFDLYCRTPFGKISKSNKDIIQLAELIGRSPSSVALKMDNLASHDPSLLNRGIVAMRHASRLDGEIWREFSNDWENLSLQAAEILAEMGQLKISDIVEYTGYDEMPEGSYKQAVTQTRVGQHFFRTTVLNSYGGSCCVTGISDPKLLIASHIKPWAESDPKTERTNPSNGLCLNPLHDKAFDSGLITIDKNYRIILSNRLRTLAMDEQTRNWICKYSGMKIKLPHRFLPDKRFIEYHNDLIFMR